MEQKKLKILRKIYRKIPKQFEKETRAIIHKSLPNAFLYKPPDGNFAGKRPFDYLILDNGLFGGIECKSKTSDKLETAFWDPNEVKPHQLDCLNKVKSNGGFAYVILGWYKLDFPNYKLEKIVLFKPEEIEELIKSKKKVYFK